MHEIRNERTILRYDGMKSEKTEIQRVLWCIHLVCKIDVIKHDLMELDDSQTYSEFYFAHMYFYSKLWRSSCEAFNV